MAARSSRRSTPSLQTDLPRPAQRPAACSRNSKRRALRSPPVLQRSASAMCTPSPIRLEAPVSLSLRPRSDTMATLTTPTFQALPEEEALLGLYKRAPMELVRGEGVELFDADGKSYLDLASGIAVNALGYSDPGLRAAIHAAADGLLHVSNLYRSAPGEQLAHRLAELS